jgi:membrane protein required for beta-lactamase induction
MMDSKSRKLVLASIVAAILWLLGGLVFNMAVGMMCVLIGVFIVGWAAGDIMDSPSPTPEQDKSITTY